MHSVSAPTPKRPEHEETLLNYVLLFSGMEDTTCPDTQTYVWDPVFLPATGLTWPIRFFQIGTSTIRIFEGSSIAAG